MAEQLEFNMPQLPGQLELEVHLADQPEQEASQLAADQPAQAVGDRAADQQEIEEIEEADPADNQPEIQEIEEADQLQQLEADIPTRDQLKPEVFYYKPVPRVIYYVADALQLAVDGGNIAVARNKNLDFNTVFHCSWYTDLPIQDYLIYIHNLVECSLSCYIVAYIYLDRLTTLYRRPPITSRNAHRLLLTAVRLAIKFLDGRRYSNKYFATLGHVRVVEMNEMEQELLFALDYKLHVSREDYLFYEAFLENFEDDNGCNYCCCFSM